MSTETMPAPQQQEPYGLNEAYVEGLEDNARNALWAGGLSVCSAATLVLIENRLRGNAEESTNIIRQIEMNGAADIANVSANFLGIYAAGAGAYAARLKQLIQRADREPEQK